MSDLRIIVVGPGLAGCTTVVGCLLGNPSGHWFFEGDHLVPWPVGTPAITVQVSLLRSLFGSVDQAWDDPVTRDDHSRIRTAQAAMFVADSQQARRPANREALARLRDLLVLNGRDPLSMPLVVLLNKRDLATARPLAQLSADHLWPRAEYFATTATTGEGVAAAFTRAVQCASTGGAGAAPGDARARPGSC